MEVLNQRIQQLTEEGDRFPALKKLADKAGVPSGYFLLGALVLAVLFIFIGFCDQILCTFVSVLYPAWKSFKALESKDDNDDTDWLHYWCVFGFFCILDEFAGFLLAFIPMYFFLKVLFFMWMFLPTTKGAEKVYRFLVRPILHKYESQIDDSISKFQSSFTSSMKDAARQASSQLSDPSNMMKMAQMANEAQSKLNEAAGDNKPKTE